MHVGTDDVEGGPIAARYVIEKLGNKGAVIELEGSAGSSPAMDRKNGFDEVIGKSNVKILASRDANFMRSDENQIMTELIRAHPAFDAVFAANDDMILGAIDAMSLGGIDPSRKITIGWDASAAALASVTDGRLDATVDSFPGQQASKALAILVDYIKNKKRPENVVVHLTPKLVTAGP